jgi:hypothetical protein
MIVLGQDPDHVTQRSTALWSEITSNQSITTRQLASGALAQQFHVKHFGRNA